MLSNTTNETAAGITVVVFAITEGWKLYFGEAQTWKNSL